MADVFGALLALISTGHDAPGLVDHWQDANGPFRSARRWVASDRPELTALFCDIEHADQLDAVVCDPDSGEFSPAQDGPAVDRADVYGAEQRNPGGLVTPTDAAALYVVFTNVAEHAIEDFDRWFTVQHQPALAKVPGVLAARKYDTRFGPHRYFAAFHLDDPAIPLSDAWLRASESPWTDRIRPSMQDTQRIIFVPAGS